MDFTPLYPLSSPSLLHFSPGSTFLLSRVGDALIVRAADDLRFVRSWSLRGGGGSGSASASASNGAATLAWSHDGAYFLSSSSATGQVHVFVLDPRRQPERGVEALLSEGAHDDSDGAPYDAPGDDSADTGAVALVETGAMRIVGCTSWAPPAAPATIFTFAGDELGMTAHCLADSSRAFFPNVRRGRYFPHPVDRSLIALLERVGSADHISIYRYVDESSGAGPSQPRSYAALLAARSSSAAGGITGNGLAANWRCEVSFPARTNDAAGIAFSHNGSLLAVWEGGIGAGEMGPPPLEYKLHILTAASGHLRGTLMIPSASDAAGGAIEMGPVFDVNGEHAVHTAAGSLTSSSSSSSKRRSLRNSTSTDADTSKEPESAEQHVVIAGGGLGIRCVAWRPRAHDSSEGGDADAVDMLAVGGYDDKIQFLAPSPSTGEWTHLRHCTISFLRKTFGAPPAAASSSSVHPAHPPCTVFREPPNWIASTAGRAIVPFDASPGPVTPPTLKPDFDKPRPTMGVQTLLWDPTGRWLAARSESMPSAVFIYRVRAAQAQVHLQAVLLFGSAVSACVWRPAPGAGANTSAPPRTTRRRARTRPQLAVVSRSAAVYLWEYLDAGAGAGAVQQRVEGVPVPISSVGVSVSVNVGGSVGVDGSAGAGAGAGVDGQPATFRPSSVRYSPDGERILLASVGAGEDAAGAGAGTEQLGAYCVGVPVEEGEEGEEGEQSEQSEDWEGR